MEQCNISTLTSLCVYMTTRIQSSSQGQRIVDSVMLAFQSNEEEVIILLKELEDMLHFELKNIFLLIPQKPVTICLYDLALNQSHSERCSDKLMDELVKVQVRATIEGVLDVAKEGVTVLPRLVIPITATETEVWHMAERIHFAARETCDAVVSVDEPLLYEVGVMLSTPRSCLRARHIALQASCTKHSVQFFLFDTDDLTEFVWGLRDYNDRKQVSTFSPTLSQRLSFRSKPFDQQVINLKFDALETVMLRHANTFDASARIHCLQHLCCSFL